MNADKGNLDLRNAREYCRRLAKSHYENFALASFFIPRRLHQHIYNIYAFARIADDYADEESNPEESLRKLNDWERQLEECIAGRYGHPVFRALAETIREFKIPLEPFRNLLQAFKQDQKVHRYATFEELLGYCRNSANPVGRIYLYLFRLASPERFALSDDICTALQLTNFWQDVRVDWQKGRIYIPGEDLQRFGVAEEALAAPRADTAFKELLSFEVARTQRLFDRGRALFDLVPANLRRQLFLFVRGGEAILAAIRKIDYDVLAGRPTLGRLDKAKILFEALRA